MRAQRVQTETTSEKADRYLAACVRAVLANAPCPPWPFALSDTQATRLLPARARFHGISVLLAQAPHGLAQWPEIAAKPVRDEMRLSGIWEELHRTRIVQLFEKLANAGVEMIVMKGTALAYLHYPDPAVRRRGDTDLLIRAKDRALTRTVLEAAGCFACENPLGIYFQETWMFDGGAGLHHMIDLHWEPVDHAILQRVVNAQQYWQNPVPVPRLSPHVSAPDKIIMLIHGAINQASHARRGIFVDGDRVYGNHRLIWSVDYAHITRSFDREDWERLADYCKTHDAAAIVYAALDGARRDLGMQVPDDIMSQLATHGTKSLTTQYYQSHSVIIDFMLNVRFARTMASRWEMLTSMIFPSRGHLDTKYPQASRWPTYSLHVRRIAEALLRLARGERRQ